MSHTIDIQVLHDGEAYASTQVRLSIGKTFFPGGRLGIYGDDSWTDDSGHAAFEVPEYDDYTDKYINVKVGGTWYGSWDLNDGGGGYTIDVAKDSETSEDEDSDDED